MQIKQVYRNPYIRKSMNANRKYIVWTTLTGLFIQFGSLLFIALFLLWFHESAKELTSIIGVLLLIIGLGLAHLIAALIMNYVVTDKQKKDWHQKGNNYATVFLVLVVPFIIYPYIDWLENNLTQMLYYSAGVGSMLIGIVCSFYLNFLKIKS